MHWNIGFLIFFASILSADADEKDEDERNEFDDLISTMPAIPEICEPRCEESHLSINFNDGMRVGLESQTSTRLKCRLEALKSSVQTLKDSVKKMHSPGMNASTLNAKATSPKGKRNKEDELKKQEELEKQIEKETRERIEATIKDVYDARRAYLGCRNLSVSCPDGLQLTFVHDEVKNELPRKTLSVRQEYVVNENGKHACDDKRSKILTEERARLITIDGTVIKVYCIIHLSREQQMPIACATKMNHVRNPLLSCGFPSAIDNSYILHYNSYSTFHLNCSL